MAPRRAHRHGLQGWGLRVTPCLLGNWGSSWPGPELPDWLSTPALPPQVEGWTVDHKSAQPATKNEGAGFWIRRPPRWAGQTPAQEQRPDFTERRSRWGVSAAQRSHDCSLSSLIIWTVTEEKRDS